MFLIIYYYIYNIINYNVQYAPHQREHVERQDLLPIRDGGIGYVEGGVYKTPPEDEIAIEMCTISIPPTSSRMERKG
jgi:hypothetical protein